VSNAIASNPNSSHLARRIVEINKEVVVEEKTADPDWFERSKDQPPSSMKGIKSISSSFKDPSIALRADSRMQDAT
jgi:hypothetical protein